MLKPNKVFFMVISICIVLLIYVFCSSEGEGKDLLFVSIKMSHCEDKHCTCAHTVAVQSLDELEFERGVWYAAQYGDLDRVKKLLSNYGCDPDQRDSAGYTALHYAARNGRLDVCKFLIEKGADLNSITRVGKATALCRASSAGKKEVVEYLISKNADLFIQDTDGKTAIHRAAENNHLSICKILLRAAPSLKEVADNKGTKIDLDVN